MITYLKKSKEELEADEKVTLHSSFRHRIFSVELSDNKKYVFKRQLPDEEKAAAYRSTMVGDELVKSAKNYNKFLEFKEQRENSSEELQYFDIAQTYKVRYIQNTQKESDANTGLVQEYLSCPNMMERFLVKLCNKNDLSNKEQEQFTKLLPHYENHYLRNSQHPHPHKEEICRGLVKILPKINNYLKEAGEESDLQEKEIIALAHGDYVYKGNFLLNLENDICEGVRICIHYKALPDLVPKSEKKKPEYNDFLKKVQGEDNFTLLSDDLLGEYLDIVKEVRLCDITPGNLKMDIEKKKLFLFDLEPLRPQDSSTFSRDELDAFEELSAAVGPYIATRNLGLEFTKFGTPIVPLDHSRDLKNIMRISCHYNAKATSPIIKKVDLKSKIKDIKSAFEKHIKTLQKVNKTNRFREKRKNELTIKYTTWGCILIIITTLSITIKNIRRFLNKDKTLKAESIELSSPEPESHTSKEKPKKKKRVMRRRNHN